MIALIQVISNPKPCVKNMREMRRESQDLFQTVMQRINQQIENCKRRVIREHYEVTTDHRGRGQKCASNRLRTPTGDLRLECVGVHSLT